ncbi:hypothetical protein EVAR_23305_1 [Eumeta japonica]|uniref:Endonuclease/exonuclease/phosphatase domain-containing protein n=1 Tax=Eumeta variegata TaxID=151549 RepID=A0A4C1XZL9_EUMVA|nr:hypothetical protein EVAR_23305_1 [Eumeta japonica]
MEGIPSVQIPTNVTVAKAMPHVRLRTPLQPPDASSIYRPGQLPGLIPKSGPDKGCEEQPQVQFRHCSLVKSFILGGNPHNRIVLLMYQETVHLKPNPSHIQSFKFMTIHNRSFHRRRKPLWLHRLLVDFHHRTKLYSYIDLWYVDTIHPQNSFYMYNVEGAIVEKRSPRLRCFLAKLLLLGDFNAHIGRDDNQVQKLDSWLQPIYLTSNHLGSFLLDFCEQHNLVISSTWSHRSCKVTCRSGQKSSHLTISSHRIIQWRQIRIHKRLGKEVNSDHKIILGEITKMAKINTPPNNESAHPEKIIHQPTVLELRLYALKPRQHIKNMKKR